MGEGDEDDNEMTEGEDDLNVGQMIMEGDGVLGADR